MKSIDNKEMDNLTDELDAIISTPDCIAGFGCSGKSCEHYDVCKLGVKMPDCDESATVIVTEKRINEDDAILGEPEMPFVRAHPDYIFGIEDACDRTCDTLEGLGQSPLFGSETMGFGFAFNSIYPRPAIYSSDLLDRKRAILTVFCNERGLDILSEDMRIASSRVHDVMLRTTVGGIPNRKRGITLYVSLHGKDDRVYIEGRKVYVGDTESDLEICGRNRIVRTLNYFEPDPKGIRYPVNECLSGSYIHGISGYVGQAMPMDDAVRLCRLYAKGTKLRYYEVRRMLRAVQTRQDGECVFGGGGF